MPATLDEVRAVIEDAFPGAAVSVATGEDHRIAGTIVWPKFSDYEDTERHRLVIERVRNRLGLRGLNVGVLFPLAPGERL
jgi:acid stress-induced BolA-like protein IbaG/YrbA